MTLSVLLTDTNRWPTPARLAIGLAKAGCLVSAVCPRPHPLLKTSAVRETFAYSGVRPLDSLIAAIDASRPDIIIPSDDSGVQHLHELYARGCGNGSSGNSTATLIERSLGAPASYPIVSSRYDLLRIAREEGLRVPDTSRIDSLEDLNAWQVRAKLPWVLKADGTFGGRGVRIAQTSEQAQESFVEISSLFSMKGVFKRLIVNRDPFWVRPWWNGSRPAVIVQSYVDGRPANCAVACWEGKVLAGIGVEVVSTEGLTGPATIVRVADNPEMMIAAERIANRLGLSGFFGLDFVIENESGAAYLIEMNPRATPLCHLQLGEGRDMVGALYAQLSGLPLRDTTPVTQNDLIAYFPQAWLCKSELLESSFQDIPEGEPDLVRALLQPWPESLLSRLRGNRTARATLSKLFVR
jgi:ATP-grasp domain-containing protein